MGGRLAGKVAIVTGGASGIGRAIAALFTAEGARIVIGDREPGPAVENRPAGPAEGKVLHHAADVTRPAEVAELVAAAGQAFGAVSVLVNCVGVSGRRLGDGPVADCTEEAWDHVLATNLKSVYLCCKHAIPAMRQSGGGSIVNIASVLGLVGDALFATHAYAASKGGILSLTRAMAVTYAPERIRVNALCPGLIDTPMSRRAAADPQVLAALPRLQPLTGAMGRAEDVAAAALFLASDDSRFITGAVLPVDGGWTAQ